MIRERNQRFKIGFILMDTLLTALAFSLAVVVHFFVMETEKGVLPDVRGIFAPGVLFGDSRFSVIVGTYSYLGTIIVVGQILSFIAVDLYHPRRGLNYLKEMVVIMRGVLFNLMIVLAILFFYRGTTFSRLVIVYSTIFSTLFLIAGHYMFRRTVWRLSRSGYHNRGVLVVGTGPAAARLVQILQKHAIYGYRILGFLGLKKEADPLCKDNILGGFRDLKKVAARLSPDLVIYATRHDARSIREVVEFCDTEGIDCRIVPDFADLITHRARIEDMEGLPILSIRDIPLRNGYNSAVKRLFDIAFSSVVLLLLSPLFLMLAALIKLDSRGPVFFLQERMGLDRKVFRVIKFRTMKVQDKSQSDTTWGSSSDARVTRLGSFLRKSSLDEIPQFINVLIGDMSVVGPRPERPHFVQQFKSQYANYMRRHSVKSGITGWAQINGYRGDTSIQKRAELDVYYIENWSFWFDVVIVAKTLPSLIRSPGE